MVETQAVKTIAMETLTVLPHPVEDINLCSAQILDTVLQALEQAGLSDEMAFFAEEIDAIADQTAHRLSQLTEMNDAQEEIEQAIYQVLDLFKGVQERKTEIAGQTGEKADVIGSVMLDIERMRRLGILVDIDIHGLSKLRTRTSWAELGIPQGDVRRERLHRGTKHLFPKHAKAFTSLDVRFRKSLERHSFVLEGFKPFRWIPVTAYDSWKNQWQKLVAEWEAEKQDLLEHYDDCLDEEAAAAAEMAKEAWDALMARHQAKARENGGGSEVAVIISNKAFEDLDAFTDYIVTQALSRFPTAKDLEHGLYPSYRTSVILSGADRAVDELRKEKLYTAQVQEQAEQEIARAQARTAETEERVKQREIEVRARAMHQAEMERARKQIAGIVSPFQEAFEQLRHQLHEDVGQLIASVQKNGHVRGKVAQRARRLHETFQLLNAHADEELEQALSELKGLLSKQPGARKTTYNTQAVFQQLKDIQNLTHESAMDVARRMATPTRARALEL